MMVSSSKQSEIKKKKITWQTFMRGSEWESLLRDPSKSAESRKVDSPGLLAAC